VSLERLPIADGIDPSNLLVLRLSWVRLGREAKSKAERVPVILAADKFICETVVLVLSQTMASQMQRLERLVRDHEFREGGRGGDRVFFHLTSASASAVADEAIFNGSKHRKRIGRSRV